jgi:C-terminal processing protease CtpA/Prc
VRVISSACRPVYTLQDGRLLSATSVKVGNGFRLALPTGAYYTWNGTALEGSPIEPDEVEIFSWQERRTGIDAQPAKSN